MNSLLEIIYPLTPGEKPSFHFALDERESAAIGYALVQWAFLEEALFEATTAICTDIEMEIPANAKQQSFRKRLKALQTVLDEVQDGDAKVVLVKTLSQITNLNGRRQNLAHGLWKFDPGDVDKLLVSKPAREPGKDERLSSQQIFEFARAVGEASFALIYPLGVPDEERSPSGFRCSRMGWRLLTGKLTPDDFAGFGHKV